MRAASFLGSPLNGAKSGASTLPQWIGISAASGIVSREAAKHVVEDKLGKKKPQFLPMNIKALEIGFSIADKFNK